MKITKKQIAITGLTMRAKHGVLEHEHHTPQTFIVDCTIELDTLYPKDDIAHTVDYGEICDLIQDIVTKGPQYNLIEALCADIAKQVLSFSPQITLADVTVHKPEAPVNTSLNDLSVTIVMQRRR